MKRHLPVLAFVLLAAPAVFQYGGAQNVPARHFPAATLPANDAFTPGAGIPASTAELSPGSVSALYLNGDGRPDLLLVSDSGEVAALRNVLGTPEDRSGPFAALPLDLRLPGAPIDLAVGDLDGDGSHDLLFLTEGERDARPIPVTGTVLASAGATITTDRRFLPHELVGQPLTPDVASARTLTVTDNTETTITVEGAIGARTGATFRVLRPSFGDPPARLVAYRNDGNGGMTEIAMPALPAEPGRMAVGVGLADADRDGRGDVLVDTAPFVRGRIDAIEETVTPRSVSIRDRDGDGDDSIEEIPAYTIVDSATTIPSFGSGATLRPDDRLRETVPVLATTTHSIIVPRMPLGVARPGSRYLLLGAADRTIVLRGLPDYVFLPPAAERRTVVEADTVTVGGASATLLVDPQGNFRPPGAWKGMTVRLGIDPFGEGAVVTRIVDHTASTLTLEPSAYPKTRGVVSVVSGGSPWSYAIIPPMLNAPKERLPDERSSFLLPGGYTAFRGAGAPRELPAALADVNGDGRPDLVYASRGLFTRLHR